MDVSKINARAEAIREETVALRHHLHSCPELSWRETETSGLIEGKLVELGLANVRRGYGGTESGVSADLIGYRPGPCVALRADIDALPLTEENDVAYRSAAEHTMHACGHDGHISILLGAAKLLSALKNELPGRVRFIFQPAEEQGERSGARAMIDEGVLDGVEMIAGLHLWSFERTGLVQWRVGPVMASSDRWRATFTGKGGHGAMPHAAVDPTIAAANFIGSIQTITSRELNPTETAVVSVGTLTSGDMFNIIPTKAAIGGSLRSFNPEVRASMEGRIRRIADGIATAFRCEAETTVEYMYPCVVNHRDATEILRETAVEIAGQENVKESPLLMVSEDFSFYLEHVPGTFFFLGAGNHEKGTDFPHHSPRFNIDDDALSTGVSLMTGFAAAALKRLESEGR
ncbi:MAG: amidohydrolase [Synergistaceae bacterium]|jgi:amidohydrolase|nr:amidohydrolase [Synergistaceae bacterium]